MHKPTPKKIQDKISAELDKLKTMLTNLAERWLDEHEYEDIDEYGAVVKKSLGKDFTFIKMHKRPFSFTFKARAFPSALYRMGVSFRGRYAEQYWDRVG